MRVLTALVGWMKMKMKVEMCRDRKTVGWMNLKMKVKVCCLRPKLFQIQWQSFTGLEKLHVM